MGVVGITGVSPDANPTVSPNVFARRFRMGGRVPPIAAPTFELNRPLPLERVAEIEGPKASRPPR